MTDDDLILFEAEGPPPLPVTDVTGWVENKGARIWYGVFRQRPVLSDLKIGKTSLAKL